jgi:hypothetical protein
MKTAELSWGTTALLRINMVLRVWRSRNLMQRAGDARLSHRDFFPSKLENRHSDHFCKPNKKC